MKLFILFALFLALFVQIHADGQKRNNVWAFGDGSGLDFNNTPPSPIKTEASIISSDYVSSICDTAGNLLFYSDGKEVWNQKHKKMGKQGVQWPWGGYTIPLICPRPDNDSVYYLFAVSDNLHKLRYLTVNMKLDNGLGGIVYPTPPVPFDYATTLLNEASVMVAGTTHCNRKDKWIVAHSGTNLLSYLVSDTGVSSIPVVSKLDASIVPSALYQLNNLKFSSNGEKLVMPLLALNKAVVFDFNNLTGLFSNPVTVTAPEQSKLEEINMSPDGTKIYAGIVMVRTEGNPFLFESHHVLQMNLEAGNETDIKNSAVELTPYPDESGCTPRTCFSVSRTLQLSPDGRMYVSFRSNEVYAHIIQEPNLSGVNTDYALYAFKYGREYVKFNINCIQSESFSGKVNGISVKKKNCSGQPTVLSLFYKNIDSVKWDFGDPASGVLNSSTHPTTEHLYPRPGAYAVTAIIYRRCFTDTILSTVIISQDKPIKLADWLRDTTLCNGDEGVWDATTPNATTYFWSDGITREPRYRIKAKGYYSVTASNECGRDTKRFFVNFESCACRIFVPNAFTPNRDNLNDVFKPITKCFLRNYDFKIYSRFGDVIFSSTDPAKGWDGYIGPYMAGSGTFVYQLQYQDPNTQKTTVKHGTVALIQ